MSAFIRFVSFGLHDADRRVAAALAPPSLSETDRYLRGSVIVAAIDRCTVRWHDWWTASEAGRLLASAVDTFAGHGLAERHQPIAIVVLTAVAAHVALTILQGPGPGWVRMVIPAMAAVGASVLLAASLRSSR